MIKHASFQIGHVLTELFGKTDEWRQIYKQTSLAFYTSNGACVSKITCLKEKKYWLRCFFNKSVEIHISANTHGTTVQFLVLNLCKYTRNNCSIFSFKKGGNLGISISASSSALVSASAFKNNLTFILYNRRSLDISLYFG